MEEWSEYLHSFYASKSANNASGKRTDKATYRTNPLP